MNTDELIARLSEAPATVPRHAALTLMVRGLVPAAFAAFLLVWAALGFRRDFAEAIAGWAYWAKFAYTLVIALLAFILVKQLSQPGRRTRQAWAKLNLPVPAMAMSAIWQWENMPPQAHHVLMFGHSALVCPWLIVMVSLPLLAGTFWAMRRLAPTEPTAGLAAGLFAGALGAWIYGFHCNESSLVFVALWYTAGILITGAIGFFGGRVLLRW